MIIGRIELILRLVVGGGGGDNDKGDHQLPCRIFRRSRSILQSVWLANHTVLYHYYYYLDNQMASARKERLGGKLEGNPTTTWVAHVFATAQLWRRFNKMITTSWAVFASRKRQADWIILVTWAETSNTHKNSARADRCKTEVEIRAAIGCKKLISVDVGAPRQTARQIDRFNYIGRLDVGAMVDRCRK